MKNKIVSPHHFGVELSRPMRNLHHCPQCFDDEKQECFICRVFVMWPGMEYIYLACCRKCLDKLKDATIGRLI